MKFSVVIPVRNEAKNIESVIFYLRKTAQYPMEVIVVDGNSADQTFLISQRIADHVLRSEKSSRGYQMHLGAQKASGNFLIFLHADTFLPQNWQEIVLIYFKDKSFFTPQFISMAVFKLRFNSDRFIYRIIEFFANLRAKITRVYHGDQVWVIPKEIYFLSGGFPDVPLMEEYYLMSKIRKWGKVQILHPYAITSCRKYESKGPILNALKNSLFIFLHYFGVSPQLLAEWYRWR